jgi:ABC-2 type transport system ATP-binding protein
MPIIEAVKLEKKYGDFTAVHGISFSVDKGEIFGFLGPNGAGKTSTIKMMIGLSRPTAGEIYIDGIDVRRQVKKAQAIMGVVPDVSNLYNELNGLENLSFCAALYGMSKEEREFKARQLLKQFKLDGAGKRPFKAYSKGMRRKLTIAAAIIHEPRILFLDEPTAGIDVISARQLRELILELRAQGTTIFFTTHNIEEAERICDRLAIIVEGKIVATGTRDELMAELSSDSHAIGLVIDRQAEGLAADLERQFKGSRALARGENRLVIKSKERIPLLPLAQHFHRHGISILEAKEMRPSLEDVFVSLTGMGATELKTRKGKEGHSR